MKTLNLLPSDIIYEITKYLSLKDILKYLKERQDYMESKQNLENMDLEQIHSMAT